MFLSVGVISYWSLFGSMFVSFVWSYGGHIKNMIYTFQEAAKVFNSYACTHRHVFTLTNNAGTQTQRYRHTDTRTPTEGKHASETVM
jgi:hypothetical protein